MFFKLNYKIKGAQCAKKFLKNAQEITKEFLSVLKEVPNMIPPAKGRTVQGFYILYYVNYIQIIIIMF